MRRKSFPVTTSKLQIRCFCLILVCIFSQMLFVGSKITYLPTCLPTYLPTYIHTYIFVVVNFDALAQASDLWIKRRQVVFLSWMQDSNPISNRLNACWQTDCAIDDQAKTWTRQPVPMISKHSAHLTPLPFGIRTWLWRYTYLLLLISMLWHRQAIFEWDQ